MWIHFWNGCFASGIFTYSCMIDFFYEIIEVIVTCIHQYTSHMDPMGKWKTCPVPQYTPQILEIGSCLSSFGRSVLPLYFRWWLLSNLGIIKSTVTMIDYRKPCYWLVINNNWPTGLIGCAFVFLFFGAENLLFKVFFGEPNRVVGFPQKKGVLFVQVGLGLSKKIVWKRHILFRLRWRKPCIFHGHLSLPKDILLDVPSLKTNISPRNGWFPNRNLRTSTGQFQGIC